MSKVNELLAQLDDAFDQAERLAQELADVRAKANDAIAKKQQELDAVKTKAEATIREAQKAADDARVALDRLRLQVNERVGTLTGMGTDPRVTVK